MDFTLSTLLSPASGSCSGAASASVDVSWMALFSVLLFSPLTQRSRCRKVETQSKKVLLSQQDCRQDHVNDEALSNRYSSKVPSMKKLQECDFSDDDDTLSTVSSTSVDDEEDPSLLSCCSRSSIGSSSSVTSLCQPRNVSFASPLVTAIHHRPACTEEDKYYLHYSEHDYIDFKLEYLTKGNSPLVRKTPRKVGFVRDVVTSTHSVLGRQERHKFHLYYNEDELQRFLDDFVTSLQQPTTL
jgi:hypothetical protein